MLLSAYCKNKLCPLLKPSAAVQEFFVAYAAHMRENVLEQLPDGFQDLTQQYETGPAKDTFPQPHLDRHVFCRVLEDRGTVDLGNDGCAPSCVLFTPVVASC